jgi:hypothetical protein
VVANTNGFLQLISRATRISVGSYSLIDHILYKHLTRTFIQNWSLDCWLSIVPGLSPLAYLIPSSLLYMVPTIYCTWFQLSTVPGSSSLYLVPALYCTWFLLSLPGSSSLLYLVPLSTVPDSSSLLYLVPAPYCTWFQLSVPGSSSLLYLVSALCTWFQLSVPGSSSL